MRNGDPAGETVNPQWWLIDKSALVRLSQSPDTSVWVERINSGLVHVSPVTLLEVGYSARSATDHTRLLQRAPIAAMPVEQLNDTVTNRALAVQELLAQRGQHRAPSIPDLLLAATAELTGLTILHDHKDFDLIAAVTGQPTANITDPAS